MDTINKISRAIAERVPGTAINIAQQKRNMERTLQAGGLSRKAAKIAVSAFFRRRG